MLLTLKGDAQKTKPTQNGIRELRGLGLSPDLICARSSTPLQPSAREKISNFCHVPPEQVYGVHDVSSIYRVPLLLDEEGDWTDSVEMVRLEWVMLRLNVLVSFCLRQCSRRSVRL